VSRWGKSSSGDGDMDAAGEMAERIFGDEPETRECVVVVDADSVWSCARGENPVRVVVHPDGTWATAERLRGTIACE
jgi:hypothetical protein